MRTPTSAPPLPAGAGSDPLGPLRIALAYAVCSALWILFSDRALAAWVTDRDWLSLLSAIKGWAFTAVTAGLLYGLLRRRAAAGVQAVAEPEPRSLALRAAVVVVVTAAMAAAAIAFSIQRHRQIELARLQAVAELKAQQVGDWISERNIDAQLLTSRVDAAELTLSWRDVAAAREREAFLARLERARALTKFQSISLLDTQGNALWEGAGAPRTVDPAVRADLARVALQRQAQRVGPYRDADGRLAMDIAVPLPAPDQAAGEAVPLLVAHLDAARYLPAQFDAWPVPSSTGEIVLVRRDGDAVLYLNALKGAPDAALTLRRPLADKRRLPVQFMESGAPEGRVIDGIGYAGAAAFGVGRQVPGTDWILLAQMDQSELYGPSLGEALWIVLAAALALFAAASAAFLARQRQQLALATELQREQFERLRALGLLAAIAEGSDDAIFAKDAEGRYTLFNPAASRLAGQTADAVIGRDDHALFPPEQAAMLAKAGRQAMAKQRVIVQEETLTLPDGDHVFLATKGPLRDGTGAVVGTFGISRDITQAKRDEATLRRANRALLAIRACGHAVMRATDEVELLRDVCSIVVETGGYVLCWVGYAGDDTERTVRPVAQSGDADGYLDTGRITWADDEDGRGPTGTAIREHRPVIARQLLEEPTFELWREAARRRGFAASIAVPLMPDSETCIGALSIVAADAQAFDDEEVRLVAELAKDLAYGIRTLRDRQARHDAQQQLREQKEQLAESQRIARVGSWQLDWSTQRLSWSEETYALYGLAPDDASVAPEQGQWRVVPEDAIACQSWLAQLRDGVAAGDLAYRIVLPGGGQRILNTRGRLERDAAGRPWRLVGTVQDITELRQAEAERLAQEARYRELFANNPHPMWVYERDTLAFLEVNDAAVTKYGFSRDEFLAMGIDQIRPGTEVPRLLDHLRRADLPHDVDGTWPHRLKDGTLIQVEISTHGLNWGGRPGVVVLAHDVTAQVQAEAEVRKLSQAVEQSPNSIVVTNLKAEIEYVNAAFLATTGYTREEVIGRNPRILQADDVRHVDHAGMWAALTRGQPWKGEFRNRRKDGSEYIELAHVAPLRQPDGTITHYVGVKEDITEKKHIGAELDRHRKHLEELVHERTVELADARQRAEAASRAKSAFLANMSHEIRTPMNAIVGLSYLLQRDQVTPAQAQRLGKIEAAALHLLSIINGILDLSKIEAGKLALEEADFPLDAVMGDVMKLITDRAQAKGVAVQVENLGVPPWLHGDAARLRQALLNYADNALKFTAQGRIWLRARLMQEVDGQLLVRLEVQDTGIGIQAEELPRLFQMFEQADASTTRRYGGTGLGLALTRRLAGLMGGQAGVDSEYGVGSTFWLTAWLRRGQTLPPADKPADDAGAALRRQAAGARVLLAEDDAVNREVATELLRAAGLEVETANDGLEAVRLARSQRFDLVLMDMQMPVMDGFHATRTLRADPALATLPILALTGNAFAEDRQACLDAGMNDFVAKPVDPPLLYGTLLRWLPPRGDGRALAEPAPPSASAEALHDALTRIDGLDSRQGLAALRGDLPVYLQLLRRLAALHGPDAEHLRTLVAEGRLEAARQLAHQLRGAAGALGATGLQDTAAALEDALRHHGPASALPALCEALCASSSGLVRGIDSLAAPRALPPAAATTPPDRVRLQAVLAELEPLIASDDIQAATLFEDHRSLLQAGLGAAAVAMAQQLEHYDFPAALATLRRALAAEAGAGGERAPITSVP